MEISSYFCRLFSNNKFLRMESNINKACFLLNTNYEDFFLYQSEVNSIEIDMTHENSNPLTNYGWCTTNSNSYYQTNLSCCFLLSHSSGSKLPIIFITIQVKSFILYNKHY